MQVRDSNNEWIYGNPISNAFVCNIGDMMQHWTGGLFKSTKHRVVNASGNQRISFPFFYEPNFDAEVRPQLSSPAVREHMQRQQEAGSETIVYGQHLMGKVYQNFDFDD